MPVPWILWVTLLKTNMDKAGLEFRNFPSSVGTVGCVHVTVLSVFRGPGSPSRPNGLPMGRNGNPELMDHPKDQPLCLVLDSQGYEFYEN